MEELTEKLKKKNYSQADQAFFKKAYLFAKNAHEGQMRLSGEPFFMHPYEVSSILIDLQLDISTIVAGLFHDIVEDTTVTISQLKDEFGEEIAKLVDGVTKVGKVDFLSKEENQAENLRKMFLAMASDIRVILVKLADRLHNMRTLKYQSKEKQMEKAKETLEIYAPLAHRLGINAIKWQLEDLALKYIDEKGYFDIADKISETRAQRDEYINAVIEQIKDMLKKIRVEAEVEGRPKHLYSIYNKIHNKQREFEEVYDLTAIRIVVKTVRDCYAVLGTIHTEWKPIPGRFKDYIAVPKQNMYQSIHTTVLGKDGRPFEVQIRTREMHSTAEYGIAAHWHYKEGGAANKDKDMDTKLAWLRELLEWQTDTRDSKEFMESLKVDFYSDRVFVFTPKGDVKEFIQGATPLDFAYGIHSEIGNKCTGAKVNSKIVPLGHVLKTGDIVEIITSGSSKGPSRDWIKIVKTTQAKSKIKNWFRKELKEENIAKGREMLEKEAKHRGYDFKALFKPEWLKGVFRKFTLQSVDDMYAAVGYGGIATGQILSRLIQEYNLLNKSAEVKQEVRKPRKTDSSGVIVKGYDDMVVRFAKCCNPVPGDIIVGYITRGRGVSVHRHDCSNIGTTDFEKARMIDVSWSKDESSSYTVEVQLNADDRHGLIAEVSNKISSIGIPMTSVNARMGKGSAAVIIVGLEINDIAQLDGIFKSLKSITGVYEVFRIHR